MSAVSGDTSAPEYGRAAGHRQPRIVRAIDLLIAAAPAVIPFLIVFRALDPFRTPKLLFLHAAGIAIAGAMAAAMIAGVVPVREVVRRRLPDLLTGAIVAWTVITATTAMHRLTAAYAVVTAASAAALFLGVRWAARRYGPWTLLLVAIPAAVNAVLAIVQELKIWNEIAPYEVRTMHAGTTALMGNPNDVGSFLVPGLIATAAWVLATRSTVVRLLLVPLALLILAGIAASRTRGALIGAAAALAVLAVVRWRGRAVLWVALLAVVAVLGAGLSQAWIEQLIDTDIQTLLSGRVMPFAVAWRMFIESPLVGVGPGCFAYAYFDYASRIYPSMIEFAIAGRQPIFGEAHNDHLQIAAETGLTGYLLFAASLLTVAAVSRRPVDERSSERVRFARLCGAPLAAGLGTLALSQFPLYLAAPLTAFVAVAGLVIGWSGEDDGTTVVA